MILVKVVIPIYKEELNSFESASLRNTIEILGRRPIDLIVKKR